MPAITVAHDSLRVCSFDYERTYMAMRNFAEATRRGYASDLRLFLGYLTDKAGITSVREVEKAHMLEYFAGLDRRGQAGATRARKLAAIKSFFGYLEDTGAVDRSAAKGLPRPKQAVREPRVLTEAEYKRLQEACGRDRRDRALVEVFLQTGLRLSEVAGLMLGDLELPMGCECMTIGTVSVTGKGRKRRTVTLNSKACDTLRIYLGARRSPSISPVFSSRAGDRLGSRAIQRIVKTRMAMAGIANASVHTLRHTFATHMVRKGTNLRVIQEALGHTSLQTTSVYVSLARELMDEQLQANAL